MLEVPERPTIPSIRAKALRLPKLLLVLFVAQSVHFPKAAAIDIFDETSVFNRRISSSNRSVLDGQSFRSSLTRLAKANQLNLWIDREVNPSSIITEGALGPTLFAAFQQIASTQNCEVMPIGNVILIGRPEWVDKLSADIMSLPASEMGSVLQVKWDHLTTPSEAFSKINLQTAGPSETLPHDHWPENTWNDVRRGIAAVLIRGQFHDEHLQSSDQQITVQKADRSIRRIYKLRPETLEPFVDQLRRQHPSIKPIKSETGVTILGSASEHRSITRWLLERQPESTSLNVDTATFSLKKMSTTAENAFRQLAATANLDCEIHQSAVNACKGIVTLEGQNVTLRKLMEGIAEQIDVMIDWQDTLIVIHR